MKHYIFRYNYIIRWRIYLFQLLEYYHASFILMMVFTVYFLYCNRFSWSSCVYRTIFLIVCYWRMDFQHFCQRIMLDLKWLLILTFCWCVWLLLYAFIYVDQVGFLRCLNYNILNYLMINEIYIKCSWWCFWNPWMTRWIHSTIIKI